MIEKLRDQYMTDRAFINTYKSKIGKKTKIAEFCEIGGAIIGERCSIQAFTYICPGVVIEDDVFIGPRVTFTNVRYPRAFIDRKDQIEPTIVKKGATIGAGAVIRCGITIGEFAMIGAGAVVTKDVAAFDLVQGVPAKVVGRVGRDGRIK